MNEATLDKRLIAESFSRAAPTYDKAAALQRTVGSNLLGRLPRDFVPGDILDLGCGTGHFTRALAACFDTPVIGLDLAEGMLRHANEHSPGLDHWITADAERLPLRSESRDLIFSSLAMQWCPRLDQALAEAWRVLRPGGCLAFNTLLEGSLEELRQSWKAVDNLVHVNSFMSLTELTILLDDVGFGDWQCDVERHVLFYPRLGELTQELKALGAVNLNAGRPSGLTGKARARRLTAAYEQFRTEHGLPASWQVAQVVMFKQPGRTGVSA